ncbi:restriction endonuclease [Verminephrobacter aporrectodeae subsp. tuberculatae]|uniref:PaeR7I family type II restriction endonuclease n=1 Tax=Verminephrobacter aporrectodeae TaxID=1110389 RepID=UPI002243A019|nr:PaeR7I family type II restriction endonuclease [Verminephrobacter aporrectodeae]MCW8208234.1 restriction endonuclease [Verminephrobacter aporrectodeae subsp. tuberculatae]
MALDLANYREQARDAIKAFWGNREAAARKQEETGNIDRGTRGAVTAGNNLNGFLALMQSLVRANGLHDAQIHIDKGLVVLPGYFRPTKQWDVVVMRGNCLVAALEFKSQVGSYGNNYNNRTEEAIGTAHCLWTAWREGALGDQPRPFLGWLMVVGDEDESRRPIRTAQPHFNVFPEWRDASYIQRYDQLCRRLVKEGLYAAAALLATPLNSAETGAYAEFSPLSGLEYFVTTFAAHIAAEASRPPPPEVTPLVQTHT